MQVTIALSWLNLLWKNFLGVLRKESYAHAKHAWGQARMSPTLFRLCDIP